MHTHAQNQTTQNSRLAYNREEVAAIIGQSPATVDRLTKRGLLKPSRATRRPMYPKWELERFLRETSETIEPAPRRISRPRSVGQIFKDVGLTDQDIDEDNPDSIGPEVSRPNRRKAAGRESSLASNGSGGGLVNQPNVQSEAWRGC